MATNDDYIDREQSLVKHYILKNYLERFAHIIGSKWNTLTYIDCFSGPWKSNASDLSDTSFAIALAELRKARDTLADRKVLDIRCLFLEENPKAYRQLQNYSQRQTDVLIETRNSTMLDSLEEILKFITDGRNDSFPFIFIDPTGWTGFDLRLIQPLLKHAPGEVLINLMTEHIRRFVDDERPEIRDSLRRCFGSDEVFSRLRAMYGNDFRDKVPQDVEDELFMQYASNIRQVGGFKYTCPAVVLHPQVERTYFHLIYATRHRRGVEVFKKVEKDAFSFQETVRIAAKERKEFEKTKQPTLFSVNDFDPSPSPRAITLRERYLTTAQTKIEQLRARRRHVPFDEIWDTAMAFPLVWDSDVKEWIAEWKAEKRINVLNLKLNQRVPQWGAGHVIEYLK